MTSSKQFKNILSALDNSSKVEIFLVSILGIISGLLEASSAVLAIPIYKILISEDEYIYQTNTIFASLLQLFGDYNPKIICLMLFIIVFLMGGLARILCIYFSGTTSASIGARLSAKAYISLLQLPLLNIQERKRSSIISLLSTQTTVSIAVIRNFSLAFGYLFATFMYCLSLIYINPLSSIIVFISIAIFYLVLALRNRKYVSNTGKAIAYYDQSLIRQVNESLGSIRLIKTLSILQVYYEKFLGDAVNLRQKVAKSEFTETYPRYLIETAGLTIFFCIASFGLIFPTSKLINFDYLIVLGIASQKTLPYIQQIYRIWIHYQHHKSYLIDLTELANATPEAIKKVYLPNQLDHLIRSKLTLDNSHINPDTLIKLNSIHLAYPSEVSNQSLTSQNIDVISDLSLDINKGDRIYISGPSGSGKSSIADIIAGLILPTKGSIEYNFNQDYMSSESALISYVPQNTSILSGTIEENIKMGLNKKSSHSDLLKSLESASILEFVESLPAGISTILGEGGLKLSGGQSQRICLARALFRNPCVLILDEATSGLDTSTEEKVMERICRNFPNSALIFISHNKEISKYANKEISIPN